MKHHNWHHTRLAVSLFSNCGAGDFGYKNAGFSFTVMAEIQPKRLRVAGLNHSNTSLVEGDLRETWPIVVEKYRQRHRNRELSLLAACPPCQGMSSLNTKRGSGNDLCKGAQDSRNLLVVPIIKVARELSPHVIVVENVPAFLTKRIPHPKDGSPISAANLLVESLAPDYKVFPFLADLAHYGVPQTRKRAFLTLIRKDSFGLQKLILQRRTPYPRPTHDPNQGGIQPDSVGSYLKSLNLPSLDSTSRETSTSMISPLHSVPIWSKHHITMVEAIPAGSGKSAWENNVCSNCGPVNVGVQEAICPQCADPLLRPVVKNKNGEFRLVRGFKSTSYRRMDPSKPAPTITTANGSLGSARTIHPTETRVLSALECSHLQTLPNDFRWTDDANANIEVHVVRRMIGEAVPPKFTELHGRAIIGILNGKWPFPLLSMYDDRCTRPNQRITKNGDSSH